MEAPNVIPYYEEDPLEGIAIGCRSPQNNQDNADTKSDIVDLFSHDVSLDRERRTSEELEVGSPKKLSSSTVLLEAHYTLRTPTGVRRTSCDSELSSGYINFNDEQNGSGVAKLASGNVQLPFGEPSLREDMALSPDSLSLELDVRPNSFSLQSPGAGPSIDTEQVSTDYSSPKLDSTEQDRENDSSLAAEHVPPSLAGHKHHDKDSGFSLGYSSDVGNGEQTSLYFEGGTDFTCHSTSSMTEDSGCPVKDSLQLDKGFLTGDGLSPHASGGETTARKDSVVVHDRFFTSTAV